MAPFITFVVIIVVIWTLSGIATAVSKQKEVERRRRLQAQLQRTAMQSRAPAPPRRISEGIAARFPDVLLPPTPPRRPAPSMPKRPPAGQKKPQRRAAAQQQRRVTAPPPPVPVATFSQATSAPLSTAAPAVESAQDRGAKFRAVDAAALAKWATPATLRQQFMLTEIFQPPLALRDRT